ncbi:MAG: MerR family transcriptional regulator [Armatimonadetes bacterium]|nr:MerR family transcriptional regulator [Armatimonadota bacterium]
MLSQTKIVCNSRLAASNKEAFMKELEILGMSEAARRLRVHPFTLRRWCEAGKVYPMRDSTGRRLFLGSDIAKLVQERELTARRTVENR